MGAFVVELGKHVIDRTARHADAEVFARHALDHVRFVEDNDIVIGQ